MWIAALPCESQNSLYRFQKELKRKKIPLEEYATLGKIFKLTLASCVAMKRPDVSSAEISIESQVSPGGIQDGISEDI